jgi:hypothetical protein
MQFSSLLSQLTLRSDLCLQKQSLERTRALGAPQVNKATALYSHWNYQGRCSQLYYDRCPFHALWMLLCTICRQLNNQ